jgi:mitogen-activated protein kinase 15
MLLVQAGITKGRSLIWGDKVVHATDKIAEGSYGSVWSGVCEDKTRVAIKAMPDVSHFARNAVREISVLRTLSHCPQSAEHFVPCSDIVAVGGTLYLVMEHMEVTLEELMRPTRDTTYKLEWSQVGHSIAEKLALALRWLHILGIVHRDVKPQNILISFKDESPQPIVKVADFGLARFLGDKDGGGLTDHVVTRWYRAPEVRGGSYSFAVDMWSLGCILGELADLHLGRRSTPLFVGHGSPLSRSKDNQQYTDQRYTDQLPTILRVLAPPRSEVSPALQAFLPSEDTPPLAERWRDVPLGECTRRLLQWKPGARLTAEQVVESLSSPAPPLTLKMNTSLLRGYRHACELSSPKCQLLLSAFEWTDSTMKVVERKASGYLVRHLGEKAEQTALSTAYLPHRPGGHVLSLGDEVEVRVERMEIPMHPEVGTPVIMSLT